MGVARAIYADELLATGDSDDQDKALEALGSTCDPTTELWADKCSGAALELAGVDANTESPEGGTILRREDGTPTGVMLALAQDLVRRVVPAPGLAQRKQAIRVGLEAMAAAGVTTVHEAGMSAADVAAFISLADEGAPRSRPPLAD